MSNSFYGGRDGAPMIIKKTFDTVEDMVNAFGTINYNEVNFGEYTLIRSEDRNNPENGRLFRRGTNINASETVQSWILNEETHLYEETNISANGAIYIGTIAGPSGNAPHLNFKQTEADVTKVYEDYNKPGYDRKTGTGTFSLNPTSQNLVSGKDHDEITWTYCSIRDKNERETDAYIGFTIPYTVIEFDADSQDPYYNRSDSTADFTNQNLVDRLDDASKPFYQKWQINIPKGIKGDSIEELKLNDSTGVITYNIRNFNIDGEGQPTLYKLNENFPLTWITGATLNTTTGKLDIDTNNGKNEIHENLTWVRDIQFDENGTVTVKYTTNEEDTVYANLIDWIKSINIAQDGTVTVASNNGTALLTNQSKLKWVTGTSLSTDGTFTTSYNNGDSATVQGTKLKWPINIQLDSSTGKVTTTYNDGSSNSSQNPQMDWIKSATLDAEKNLSIDYVNAADINVPLKTPNKIELIDGVIYATYNTSATPVALGAVENQISACAGIEADSNLNVGGVWFVTEE